MIGSVFTSVYGSKIVDGLRGQPGSTVAGAKGSVGAALAIASRLPGAAGRAFAEIARHAFVDGFHTAVLVGAATTAAGVIAVLAFLPSRPHPSRRRATGRGVRRRARARARNVRDGGVKVW